jgi:Tfp pilus assembly protein PilO
MSGKGVKISSQSFKPLTDAMGKNRELWFWVLKYGGVLVAFLFFFIPVESRLSSYLVESGSLQREIDSIKQITATLLTPEEIERVKGRVDQFEAKLAGLTSASAILDDVTKIVEDSHLKMIQIYSDSPVLVKDEKGRELEAGGKKLSLLPVNFRVEADYKNLATFLKKLNDTSQWTFTVESFQLQTPSADGENLQCDITLSYIIR